MLRCKISLACKRPIAYVVHRSNAVPDRAVCFLGRFLPKLGGATSVAIFLRAAQPAVRVRAVPAKPAMSRVMLCRSAGKPGSCSIRASSI